METNEIMVNNEVTETATEVVVSNDNTGNIVKVAVGVGAALLLGKIIYKRIVKPARAKKAKARMAEDIVLNDGEEFTSNDVPNFDDLDEVKELD